MNVMLQTILAKPSSQRTPAPPPGLRAWKQKNIGKSSSFFHIQNYSTHSSSNDDFLQSLWFAGLMLPLSPSSWWCLFPENRPWKKEKQGKARDDTTSRHHIYKRIDVQHDSRGLQCDSHGPYSVLVTLVTLALSSRRVLRPCRERLKNFMI